MLDIYRVYGTALDRLGWNGIEQVRSLMQQAVSNTDVRSAFNLTGFGLFSAGTTAGTENNDAFAGDATANSFSAGAGDDLIDGQAGNDNLSGAAGDDLILGGAGNDTLNGNDGCRQARHGVWRKTTGLNGMPAAVTRAVTMNHLQCEPAKDWRRMTGSHIICDNHWTPSATNVFLGRQCRQGASSASLNA